MLLLASDRVASRDCSVTKRQLEIDVVTVKGKRATPGHACTVACQGGFKQDCKCTCTCVSMHNSVLPNFT